MRLLPCFLERCTMLSKKYGVYSSDKVTNIYYIGDHTCSPRDIHRWASDVVKSALVNIKYEMKTQQESKIQNGELFTAAGDLKLYTYLRDSLLICAINGNEQHVFKTCTSQIKIVFKWITKVTTLRIMITAILLWQP